MRGPYNSDPCIRPVLLASCLDVQSFMSLRGHSDPALATFWVFITILPPVQCPLFFQNRQTSCWHWFYFWSSIFIQDTTGKSNINPVHQGAEWHLTWGMHARSAVSLLSFYGSLGHAGFTHCSAHSQRGERWGHWNWHAAVELSDVFCMCCGISEG